jgi:hypothetical protein
MVDTIVNLLQETSNQRDALTNAAEHLFSDMRVVSAGDLRINAPVSDDPIGMLANAFNFTVSRFRRFLLRVQTTIEQIDVISRQELERAEQFALVMANQQGQALSKGIASKQRSNSGELLNTEPEQADLLELATQIRRTREHLQKMSVEGIRQSAPIVQALGEQLTRVVNAATRQQQSKLPEGVVQLHVRDVQMMEQLLQRMLIELRNAQQNTAQNLTELDRELTLLSQNIRKGKTSSSAFALASSKEQSDLTRLSSSFAAEVGSLARKLGALSQEMRTGIVAFQLEMPEQANNPVSYPSSPNTIPTGHTSSPNLLAPEQRSPTISRPHHALPLIITGTTTGAS